MEPSQDVRSIPDFMALPFEEKHVLARKALVHQTDDVQVSAYILEPGGRVPFHRHTRSWDISIVIEGEIEVRFSKDGTLHAIRCKGQAINLVPPGTAHEILNPSDKMRAAFLLIQSPSKGFDFVKAASPSEF